MDVDLVIVVVYSDIATGLHHVILKSVRIFDTCVFMEKTA